MHEVREKNGREITYTPDESIVGSRISAVCVISFELFFSVTQELINFSLFNPPSPSLFTVRLYHRIAYSLCTLFIFLEMCTGDEGMAEDKKRDATGKYRYE